MYCRLDPTSGYSDAPGVTITAADFGSTSSVEILGPSRYFNSFVEYFVQRGYTRDVNIRAAPYDWRLATGNSSWPCNYIYIYVYSSVSCSHCLLPSTEQLNQRGYYTALKQLVEQMYKENSNTKVTLVAHSMGGPVSLYFLTSIATQKWKDTYIDSYIPLAGAWSGGNVGIPILLTGPVTDDFLQKLLRVSDLRFVFKTYASPYLLFPRTSVWNDTILISTPTQNYTANDYQQLFTDAGYPEGFTQLSDIRSYTSVEFPAPNVPTYCFYGLGVPTPESFVYGTGFPDTFPTIVNGDGDIEVNKRGLEVCLQWADSGYPFSSTVFQGIDHLAIVTDKSVLQTIGSIVGAPVNSASILSSQRLKLHCITVMVLTMILSFIIVKSFV